MAGLLSHLAIAFFGALIILVFTRKIYFSLLFIVGHLIPDVLKFGLAGLKLNSIDYFLIVRDPLFHKIDLLASNYHLWISAMLLVIGASYFLFCLRKIKKDNMKNIALGTGFFIIGVLIHLIIDIFIIEKNYWF